MTPQRFVAVGVVWVALCAALSPVESATPSASAAAVPAGASVMQRVKARGYVRCGSVERPGLAHDLGNGRWVGLNVDVCRAVAAAVLGSPDRVQFHDYETEKEYDDVRRSRDDVSFLTGAEIHQHQLAGAVVPGPAVFFESDAVMVAAASPVQHLDDLAGDSICFMIGSAAERTLEAHFDAAHKTWLRQPYSEDGEMNDGYVVQQCHGVAGELTTLALTGRDKGVNHMASRILPERLAVFPVLATTGTADARWTALVAWTVHTLVSAERPESTWYAGGAKAMPVTAPGLGLDAAWQSRVVAAVGHYGDIYERNLGQRSPLKLERGVNANQLDGGLLLSPFLE